MIKIKTIVYECACGKTFEKEMASRIQRLETLEFPNKICLHCGRIIKDVKVIKQ